jgi:hypothetical protein
LITIRNSFIRLFNLSQMLLELHQAIGITARKDTQRLVFQH